MAWLFWICLNLFLAISIIMVLLVLIQKGRGGGLAGAFGGAGGENPVGAPNRGALPRGSRGFFWGLPFFCRGVHLGYERLIRRLPVLGRVRQLGLECDGGQQPQAVPGVDPDRGSGPRAAARRAGRAAAAGPEVIGATPVA